MFKKVLFTAVTGVIISFGIAGSASADPDGSQRNRGLGDRVFSVDVETIFAVFPIAPFFPNCYAFNADGSWEEPGNVGDWIQHSNGAKTSYTATAPITEAPGLILIQDGNVTPAKGKGVLQIEAYTSIYVALEGGGPDLEIGALAVFLSIGAEVDECTL